MKFVPTIRPAIQSDAPYLIDIDVKCFDHSWLDEDWAFIWEDGDANIHVSLVYGNPIGFMVTERQVYNDKRLNHIYKVAVREQFRGNNLGKLMLAKAYNEAKMYESQYLSMSIPESMLTKESPRYCLPWIEKMGFKAVETTHESTALWGQKEDVIMFTFEVQ